MRSWATAIPGKLEEALFYRKGLDSLEGSSYRNLECSEGNLLGRFVQSRKSRMLKAMWTVKAILMRLQVDTKSLLGTEQEAILICTTTTKLDCILSMS